MKRRKAIRQIGLGLSAGWVAPQMLASCDETNFTPDVVYDGNVVIIGAGIAGLYTASILRAKGIPVSILEASNQLGGRIRSLRNQADDSKNTLNADFPIELGADIIYGSDSLWARNIVNDNINMLEVGQLDSNRYIIENTARPFSEWGADTDFIAVQNFIKKLDTYSGFPVTVRQAANAFSDRIQPLLNSQIGNFYGADNNLLGILGLSNNLGSRKHDGKFLMPQSSPMQDILISRFHTLISSITLNAPVTSIDYTGDKIAITDGHGKTTEANKVIVTVPISILKNNEIAFKPGLPGAMIGSMNNIGMGSSIRILISFKKNFWGDMSSFLWGMTSAPQCFNTGIGRSESPSILSITVHGSKAEEFSSLGVNVINEIISELDAIYDGQATRFIDRERSAIQNWGTEQYIKGGYSYPIKSTSNDDRINIAKPIGDKVFFAGEATDMSGDAGNINGALASAERVSEEVIKSILI